ELAAKQLAVGGEILGNENTNCLRNCLNVPRQGINVQTKQRLSGGIRQFKALLIFFCCLSAGEDKFKKPQDSTY
ncbi:hypothetical protein QIG09_26650, partial [Klebsiella pneumoniae]|nr:hypothetical protein [Klebsiella pneumoniae]